eukprot:5084367-Amphidinium_carterae.1
MNMTSSPNNHSSRHGKWLVMPFEQQLQPKHRYQNSMTWPNWLRRRKIMFKTWVHTQTSTTTILLQVIPKIDAQ